MWDVSDPAHPVRTDTLSRVGFGEAYTVAFGPDQQLLASGHEDAAVRLWDVREPAHPGTTATLTGHGSSVRAVAFSPDGRLLASCSADGTVKLWDLR